MQATLSFGTKWGIADIHAVLRCTINGENIKGQVRPRLLSSCYCEVKILVWLDTSLDTAGAFVVAASCSDSIPTTLRVQVAPGGIVVVI